MKRILNKKFLLIYVLSVVLVLTFVSLSYADFPEKEVEWIIWSSPGGGSDITARTVGIPLRKALEQPLIIINMTGGSGARAMTYVQNKKADGYTWLFVTNTLITTITREIVSYKLEDFRPVVLLNHDAHLIAVNTDSDIKTIEDLIKIARKNPIKWGITHFGGTDHVATHIFAEQTGANIVPIVYQGGGEQTAAALSGVLDAFITNTAQILGQVEAGKIRILACMADKRLNVLPDVPTLKEKGYDIVLGTWRGVVVKKDTDEQIASTIEKYFIEASKTGIYLEFLKNQAMDYNVKNSKEFEEFIRDEYTLYSQAIKEIVQ